jgi:predicted ATPase/DNA-binding SARP family transcriptional activator/Tfp pilus assembly protein PilF
VTGFSSTSPARIILVLLSSSDTRDDRRSRLPLTYGTLTAMRRHEGGAGVGFRLLGPLEVVRDGQALSIGGARQRGLLALLLLHANELVGRERLIDGLWGDEPPETAPNSLQVAVHALRKLLGSDRIVTRGRGYVLRVEPGESDLERFERLVERARGEKPVAAADTLREALSLWRGPALADLPDAPFARAERERLDEIRLSALELRLEADLGAGRHDELVAELEALVAQQPFRERLRRLLMLALYRAGRQAEALEAYQQARRAFVEELGIEPTPALQELERAILRQDPALAAPAPAPKTNVPAPLTPLIGRQLELAAATALLRGGDVRLLTLTGPGGIGKTRLAVEIARELLADFRDGVCFVDLSPLRDAALVGPQILRALDVAEQPGRTAVATLKEALREQELLLLLDNFEQVDEAGPVVTELLASAPEVKSLVTSRAVLHVSGEHEYPLPPLPLPDLARGRADALPRNDAVELFAARARAVAPAFKLTAANSPAVAAICVALDGLPLAIELAAARTRVLSPDELLERFERLELLVAGPRDAPARQQTLRATLDWSFELLAAEEQQFYARLAVFSGGWTLEAAEAVCATGLEDLSSLSDKSLVRREDTDEAVPRFRMLETIREYALERLEESGEAERLRRRHAEYFRELAEQAARETGAGASTASVYGRLESDLDNLRAALTWADGAGASELALGIAGALKLFWRVRGHLGEGRRWLETALEHARGETTPARARALEAVGALAQRSGDYAEAKAFWQEGLDIWRALGDERGVARSLGDLASVFDLEGDADQALPLYEESAELFRRLGLEYELAPVVSNHGDCLMSLGRLEEAGALFEEAVELCRASGREEQLVISMFNRGRVSALQDRHGDAAELFKDALRGARDLGYREMTAYCLKGIAEVLAAQGEASPSAHLLGASDQLFDELGAHVEAIERDTYERAVESLKAELGVEPFTAAHTEGRSMPLEHAVAMATGASPTRVSG